MNKFGEDLNKIDDLVQMALAVLKKYPDDPGKAGEIVDNMIFEYVMFGNVQATRPEGIEWNQFTSPEKDPQARKLLLLEKLLAARKKDSEGPSSDPQGS